MKKSVKDLDSHYQNGATKTYDMNHTTGRRFVRDSYSSPLNIRNMGAGLIDASSAL